MQIKYKILLTHISEMENKMKKNISNIVEDWCNNQNIETGAKRYQRVVIILFLLWIAIMYVLFEIGNYNQITWAVVLAVVGFTFLAINAPRMQYLDDIRFYGKNRSVPDSILEKIADTPTIQIEAKQEIAHIIEKQGFITFGKLFDVEQIFNGKHEKLQQQGRPGFQKISKYKDL